VCCECNWQHYSLSATT